MFGVATDPNPMVTIQNSRKDKDRYTEIYVYIQAYRKISICLKKREL